MGLREAVCIAVLLHFFVDSSTAAAHCGGAVCHVDASCPDTGIVVVNPSFDDDAVGGFAYRDVTGWQGHKTIVVKNGNGPWGGLSSGTGANFVSLQTNSAFVEQEVLGLMPGAQYTLSFKAANRPGYGSTELLSVRVDGSIVLGPLHPANSFTEYSVEFNAAAGSMLLRFDNDSPAGDHSVFVDDVVLVGVSCTCNAGYEGDGATCADVDECSSGSATCSNAECTNTAGSFTCSPCAHMGPDPDPVVLDCSSCTTSQISTAHSGSAARALDGMGLDGQWHSGGCTHTDSHSQPWWQVDLGDVKAVSHMKVWNRMDCCSSRLAGFRIWIAVVDDKAAASLCYQDSASVPAAVTEAPCVGLARYIWVDLPTSVYLTLCEVEIYHFLSTECSCDPGYELNADGRSCDDINECSDGTHSCSPESVCVDTEGSFTCECISGYSRDGERCSDVDECTADSDDCDAKGECTNTDGSFTCECNTGWTSTDSGVTCTDVDECGSSDNCDDNAECTNTDGSFTCACNAGFTGSDGTECNDMDECAVAADNNCDANAECTNTAGSFTCSCTAGYEGDGATCSDIDECASGASCGAGEACVNTAGSYACECLGGYARAVSVLDVPYERHAYSSVWSNDAVGTNHGRGRLDSPQAWSAGANNQNQWMQLDAGSPVVVHGVVSEGRSDAYNQWVTSYAVSVSMDGASWEDVDDGAVFVGNVDRLTAVQNSFASAPTARYVRLHPKTWEVHLSMRAGLVVGGACVNVDECEDVVHDCGAGEECVDTAGSFLCIESTCSDGMLNQDEEGVDCGPSCERCPTECAGAAAPPCGGVGGSNACADGSCAPCASCSNGAQDGDEEDVDCGGSSCLPCTCPRTNHSALCTLPLRLSQASLPAAGPRPFVPFPEPLPLYPSESSCVATCTGATGFDFSSVPLLPGYCPSECTSTYVAYAVSSGYSDFYSSGGVCYHGVTSYNRCGSSRRYYGIDCCGCAPFSSSWFFSRGGYEDPDLFVNSCMRESDWFESIDISDCPLCNGPGMRISMHLGVLSFGGDWSIEARVRLGAHDADATLFHSNQGSMHQVLGLFGTTGRLMLEVTHGSEGTKRVVSPDPLPLEQWVHVTATISGGTATVYIDGLGVAEHEVDAVPVTQRAANSMGKHTTLGRRWRGKVSDVRMYSRALDAVEVAALSTGAVPKTLIGDVLPLFPLSVGDCELTCGATGYVWPAGRMSGGAEWVDVSDECAGCSGEAVRLQGSWESDDFITLPQMTYDGGDVTYELRVKAFSNELDENGEEPQIFHLGCCGPPEAGMPNINNHVMGFKNQRLRFDTYDNLSPGPMGFSDRGARSVTTSGAFPVDQWVHVVARVDRSYGRLYLDGALAASGYVWHQGIETRGSNYVGRTPFYPAHRFHGLVSDFRIYTQALSAADIASLASGGVPCPLLSLILTVLPFDTVQPPAAGPCLASGYSFPAAAFKNGAQTIAVTDCALCSGQGVALDGVDDYLELGLLTLKGTGVSYEAWVKVEAVADGARVFDFGNGELRQNHVMELRSGRLRFAVVWGGQELAVRDAALFPMQQWTHVAATVVGGLLSLFVAGTQADARFVVGYSDPALTRTANFIGRGLGPHHAHLHGVVADFRVLERALSAAEVLALSRGWGRCRPCSDSPPELPPPSADGSCDDGVQNRDEAGIDCGGAECGACHCVNGAQDADEEGVDCGGVDCAGCGDCFDGLHNVGEAGADCGGRCAAPCAEGDWRALGRAWWVATHRSASFAEAREECVAWGGQLAAVQTQCEQSMLLPRLGGRSAWIGLRRAQQDAVWEWEDGSVYGGSAGWHHLHALAPGEEWPRDCAYVSMGESNESGWWRTRECAERLDAFVCSKPDGPQLEPEPPACNGSGVVGCTCVWFVGNAYLARSDAQRACEAFGGALGSLTHEELAVAFEENLLPEAGWADTWLGLKRDEAGLWVWEDGTHYSHGPARWLSGRLSSMDSTASCVFANADRLWVNARCDQRLRNFVCTKPMATPHPPPFASDCAGVEALGRCWWTAREEWVAYGAAQGACEGWGGALAAVTDEATDALLKTWEDPGWIGLQRPKDGAWRWADGAPYLWHAFDTSALSGIAEAVVGGGAGGLSVAYAKHTATATCSSASHTCTATFDFGLDAVRAFGLPAHRAGGLLSIYVQPGDFAGDRQYIYRVLVGTGGAIPIADRLDGGPWADLADVPRCLLRLPIVENFPVPLSWYEASRLRVTVEAYGAVTPRCDDLSAVMLADVVLDFGPVDGPSTASPILAASEPSWRAFDSETRLSSFTCSRPLHPPPPSASACGGNGWEAHGKCWWVLRSVHLAWEAGQRACEQLAGSLASVQSAEEKATLQSQLEGGWSGGWIGLRREDGRGGWAWQDGSAVVYEDWKARPWAGETGGLQCVEADSAWQWRERDCHQELPDVLCSRPLAPLLLPLANGQFEADAADGPANLKGWAFLSPSSWLSSGTPSLIAQGNAAWGGLSSGNGRYYVGLQGAGDSLQQQVGGLLPGELLRLSLRAARMPSESALAAPSLRVQVAGQGAGGAALVVVDATLTAAQLSAAAFRDFVFEFAAPNSSVRVSLDTHHSAACAAAALVDAVSLARVQSAVPPLDACGGQHEGDSESGCWLLLRGDRGVLDAEQACKDWGGALAVPDVVQESARLADMQVSQSGIAWDPSWVDIKLHNGSWVSGDAQPLNVAVERGMDGLQLGPSVVADGGFEQWSQWRYTEEKGGGATCSITMFVGWQFEELPGGSPNWGIVRFEYPAYRDLSPNTPELDSGDGQTMFALSHFIGWQCGSQCGWSNYFYIAEPQFSPPYWPWPSYFGECHLNQRMSVSPGTHYVVRFKAAFSASLNYPLGAARLVVDVLSVPPNCSGCVGPSIAAKNFSCHMTDPTVRIRKAFEAQSLEFVATTEEVVLNFAEASEHQAVFYILVDAVEVAELPPAEAAPSCAVASRGRLESVGCHGRQPSALCHKPACPLPQDHCHTQLAAAAVLDAVVVEGSCCGCLFVAGAGALQRVGEAQALCTHLALVDLNLASLHPAVFAGMVLRVLDVRRNRLTELPAAVLSDLAPSLRALRLGGNALWLLPAGIFSALAALEELDLHGNRLPRLAAGAFEGLAALRTLDLHDNELGSLEPGTLHGLPALRVLNLGGNRLEQVPAGLLGALGALERLELHNNRLATIAAGAFAGLAQLRRLALHGNRLGWLAPFCFEGLGGLRELDLRRSGIEGVAARAFEGLEALEVLSLQGNRISMLNTESFAGLGSVVTLNLQFNNMAAFPVGLFRSMVQLQVLLVQPNPLSCHPVLPTTVLFTDLMLPYHTPPPLCLPEGCNASFTEHVTVAGAGAQSAHIHMNSAQSVLAFVRPDMVRSLDVAMVEGGSYVDVGQGFRCWCLVVLECFELGRSSALGGAPSRSYAGDGSAFAHWFSPKKTSVGQEDEGGWEGAVATTMADQSLVGTQGQLKGESGGGGEGESGAWLGPAVGVVGGCVLVGVGLLLVLAGRRFGGRKVAGWREKEMEVLPVRVTPDEVEEAGDRMEDGEGRATTVTDSAGDGRQQPEGPAPRLSLEEGTDACAPPTSESTSSEFGYESDEALVPADFLDSGRNPARGPGTTGSFKVNPFTSGKRGKDARQARKQKY